MAGWLSQAILRAWGWASHYSTGGTFIRWTGLYVVWPVPLIIQVFRRTLFCLLLNVSTLLWSNQRWWAVGGAENDDVDGVRDRIKSHSVAGTETGSTVDLRVTKWTSLPLRRPFPLLQLAQFALFSHRQYDGHAIYFELFCASSGRRWSWGTEFFEKIIVERGSSSLWVYWLGYGEPGRNGKIILKFLLVYDSYRIICNKAKHWFLCNIRWALPLKADSHLACCAHAVPMPSPCHAVPLIHTCHAAPLPCPALPCSDTAVSFVKLRAVAGNIRTASPTV